MARVTVEDCIEVIPNRFELIIAASQRAKQIASGAPLTLDRDNDKDAVVSLREIAEQSVQKDTLLEETIVSFTTRQMAEIFDESDVDDEVNTSDNTAIATDVEAMFSDVAQSDDDMAREAEGAMSFEDVDIDD